MKECDEMVVFKSYLRNLLNTLKDLKTAIETHNEEKALEIVNRLMKNVQSGIED